MTSQARTIVRRRAGFNPVSLALRKAARLTAQELAFLKGRAIGHLEALRTGNGTPGNFAGVASVCKLGQAIESLGVVRGLSQQFDAAEQLLLGIQDRAEASGCWVNPVLTDEERGAIGEMVDLHLFQLEQLSYGEYQAAWRLMIARTRSAGGQVINYNYHHETAH